MWISYLMWLCACMCLSVIKIIDCYKAVNIGSECIGYLYIICPLQCKNLYLRGPQQWETFTQLLYSFTLLSFSARSELKSKVILTNQGQRGTSVMILEELGLAVISIVCNKKEFSIFYMITFQNPSYNCPLRDFGSTCLDSCYQDGMGFKAPSFEFKLTVSFS